MAIPINGWGSSSYSRDISNNYTKTHHIEKVYENSLFSDFFNSDVKHYSDRPSQDVWVKNDEKYLNSLYEESEEVKEHYSYSDASYEYFLSEQNKEFDDYVNNLPDYEHIIENNFDAHGNYMDDDYFFERDYEGRFCYLYEEDEEEIF